MRWLVFVLLCSVAAGQLHDCPAALVKPCQCVRDSYLEKVQCSNFSDLESLQEVFDNSIDHPFDGFILQNSNVMYLAASWFPTKKIQQITVRDSSMTGFFDHEPSTDNKVSHIFLYNVKLLRGIQWEQFKSLQSLLDITVHDVEVRKIGKSFTDNVTPKLRKIKLKGTKTTQLEDTVFQPFKEVDWFELQDAQVTTLKRSMFANPSRLFVFDFRNNHIASLPNDMFVGMERLQNIHLNGNRLVTLPAAVFSNVYENYIFELEVQNNPLMCDCSISWLVYSTRYVEVTGYCSAPSNLKDRHLLQLKREEFKHCPQRAVETY